MKDNAFMDVLSGLAGERPIWQVPEIAARLGLSPSGFRNRMKALAGRGLFEDHPASGCVGAWEFYGRVLTIEGAPCDHKKSKSHCLTTRVLAWLESQPDGAQIDYASAERLSPPIPAARAKAVLAHLCRAGRPVARVFRPPVAWVTLPSGRALWYPNARGALRAPRAADEQPLPAPAVQPPPLVPPAPPAMTRQQSLDADAFLRAVADAGNMAPFTPPPAGELSIRIDAVARDVACPRPILVRQLLALGLDALRAGDAA